MNKKKNTLLIALGIGIGAAAENRRQAFFKKPATLTSEELKSLLEETFGKETVTRLENLRNETNELDNKISSQTTIEIQENKTVEENYVSNDFSKTEETEEIIKQEFKPTSLHQGKDWANVGYGPNQSSNSSDDLKSTQAVFNTQFIMNEEVAQKFNAYAKAAWPSEIGGLLKIDESEPGIVRAVDIKIFTHKVAHGTYWEADEKDIARFMMELYNEGRDHELEQWRCLIHSHPNMSPFLSGTDRQNIIRLAGNTNAWSVICAAKADPDLNWFAVHYAQKAPMPMIIKDLPVKGENLSGVDSLSDETIEQIENEVVRVLKPARGGYRSWSGSGSYVSSKSNNKEDIDSETEKTDSDDDDYYVEGLKEALLINEEEVLEEMFDENTLIDPLDPQEALDQDYPSYEPKKSYLDADGELDFNINENHFHEENLGE